MTRVLGSVTAAFAGLLSVFPLGAQTVDELIAQAVRPLPEDLRADATVFHYDAETGERNVLRQGTNHVECLRRSAETGFTRCHPVSTAARRDLSARLQAQGMSGDEVDAALAAAEAAGTIEPVPFASLRYRLYEDDDRIQLLWIVALPNAMAEDLAMPTASQRDSSLAGRGLPWMMREGTPSAHLMIPINGTELSNAGGVTTRMDTKAVDDLVTQATLPLPEDLKATATVVTYDPETGERKVLRQGSSRIECQPRSPSTGFTRCYHELQAPERALGGKLRAQGKSEAEVGAEIAAARIAGTIPERPYGALDYRLYEDDDRLRLLWILRVPNATSEELGMPTGSQRDNSLAGRGTPWMMREGTPAAHLMIPINGTALSN